MPRPAKTAAAKQARRQRSCRRSEVLQHGRLARDCFKMARHTGKMPVLQIDGVSLVIWINLKRAKRTAAMLFPAIGAAVAFLSTSVCRAADVLPGWGSWWLPPDRSVHGSGMDSLFYWIFWLTMVLWIAV